MNFVFCRTELFEKDVIAALKMEFKVGTCENQAFKYLGLNVKLKMKYMHIAYIHDRIKDRNVTEKKKL